MRAFYLYFYCRKANWLLKYPMQFFTHKEVKLQLIKFWHFFSGSCLAKTFLCFPETFLQSSSLRRCLIDSKVFSCNSRQLHFQEKTEHFILTSHLCCVLPKLIKMSVTLIGKLVGFIFFIFSMRLRSSKFKFYQNYKRIGECFYSDTIKCRSHFWNPLIRFISA
jgi:hypothetical protein